MILSCKEDPRLSEFLPEVERSRSVYLLVRDGRGWWTSNPKGSPSGLLGGWSLRQWEVVRNGRLLSLVDFLRENYPEALL